MLDTVVAIGVGDDSSTRKWIGTGFLFEDALGGEPARPKLYLVTNKHILSGPKKIWVKFNSASTPDSTDYPLSLKNQDGKELWTGHPSPNVDVAVISVSGDFLVKNARRFKFFKSDAHLMKKTELISGQVTEGDRVFVLGFPLGLVDPNRQYTICRHGILSRIRDHLEGAMSSFLIDASIFPGNSGGPVIICPSVLAIEGTRANPRAALIGIVKEYLSYEDIAVSRQTGRPRISFQENSGLALVESVDSLSETIAADITSKMQSTEPPTAIASPSI